ncbi:hypothetical protein NKJ87_19010 [Mesorhizobium sp. M0027]|uniref:hypothetical protein n=1 Tax=Mesorhizobium sp. M0027 TaxID=2956848 RepID=UPI003334F978
MARTKPSERLSQAEIDRFLAAAEALHKSIVSPLLAYHSENYQALREVQSIETITGHKARFIQWDGTGPAQPREPSG